MKITEKLENMFAAIAFAEEGEADTARGIMEEGRTNCGTETTDCCDHCGGATPAKA